MLARLSAVASLACGSLLLATACTDTEPAADSADVASAAAAPAVKRPNVLLLFADDQRPDTIGAWGNEHIRTPHVDALAGRGFSFRGNYCMGSMHGAVCQPSRAMLMSGRSLWKVPMNLRTIETLPLALRGRGYRTFVTGKWHNGQPSCLRSFERGKAILFGGMSNHEKVPLRDLTVDGGVTEQREGKGFSSELFADAAIEFLEQHDGADPFFAYVSFTAPHDPRQPPEKWREHYYRERPPLPDNFLPQHPFDNGWLECRDEKLAAWPRTREVLSDQLAEYYGMISHLDEQVGRILAVLERTGHAEDTVVVYAADHGLAMGSHGLLGKQNLYEHSMGCPLIIAGPGIPVGSTAAFTYLLDLFPTLCAVAGAPVPEAVEGVDLAPLWRGEVERVRDSLYLVFDNVIRSVRDDRYKLIRYPLIDHVQLFDLAADPGEKSNLAADPDHGDRVARMTESMREWHGRIADPHLLSVDSPGPMEIDLGGKARKPDRWQPRWIVDKYFAR